MSDWATPYARGVEQDGRDSAVMMTMDKVAKPFKPRRCWRKGKNRECATKHEGAFKALIPGSYSTKL